MFKTNFIYNEWNVLSTIMVKWKKKEILLTTTSAVDWAVPASFDAVTEYLAASLVETSFKIKDALLSLKVVSNSSGRGPPFFDQETLGVGYP